MISNKINLFLTAILIIVLYFTIPRHNAWFYNKIVDKNRLAHQLKHLDITERRANRYGSAYTSYQDMKKQIIDPGRVVILFPPRAYLAALRVTNFTSPEPAEFYYYTGLKSVWANSPNAGEANCELSVRSDKTIVFETIESKAHLDSMITLYKRFFR